VYANHSTIVDFADAERIRPQLDISLLEGEAGVAAYPLRVAAFSHVHSVSLYFVRPSPSRLGTPFLTDQNESVGEKSRLYYIGFKGDVRSAKHAAPLLLDVPAPTTGDAKLIERVSEKAATAR